MRPASIEWIDSCDSTNTLMKSRGEAVAHGHVIATRTQTAGRGQRGNSWEAEPGKNLTFSQMLRTDGMDAERQYELSMLTALAILNVLERHLGRDARLSIKWPNDIYAADRKLGGILIEGSVCAGCLDHIVLGAGINVNQSEFRSDAPNPVSMTQITGKEYDLEALMQEIGDEIADQMAIYEEDPDGEALRAMYKDALWRREGMHAYRDTATGEHFEAEIADVLPSGLLRLRRADGSEHDYEFKQVAAIL